MQILEKIFTYTYLPFASNIYTTYNTREFSKLPTLEILI